MVTPMLAETPDLNYIVGLMSGEFRAEVVQRALAWRKNAGGDQSRSFQSVLRKNVKIKGFRNPHKAGNQLLLTEILRLLPFSAELVGPVLRIWMDSHSELYKEVYGHLSALNLPVHGLDFSENRFAGSWSSDIWHREKENILASHSHFNEDDVALMLCCVSGNMPDPDESNKNDFAESQGDTVFSQWLEEMRELPADAPQWQQANEFVASATEIIQYKSAVRSYTLKYKAILAELKQEVGRELTFFQCDPDSWSVERLSDPLAENQLAAPEDIAELLHQIESLKALLTDYKPVHDIAPTIEEELALWPQRGELQRQILSCLSQIYQMFSYSDEKDEDQAAIDTREASPVPGSTVPPCEGQVGPAQIDSTQPDAQISSAEVPNGPSDSTDAPAAEESISNRSVVEDDESDSNQPSIYLRSDESGLGPSAETPLVSDTDHASLESENKSLRQELQELRGELKTTQEIVRLWRIAYEKARKQIAPTVKPPSEDEFLPIEDVRTAVALAREKYAGELLFQPNSKSEIEDNPYEKPTNVLAALEWLATTYYRSKTGEERVPNFDSSIKKVCGWRYMGSQSKYTMTKYKPWYTTSLEGRTYWLKRHVGSGSNKDSRYTIRIAFDWDSIRQVVVIGYIGQHQQTDAT